MTFFSYKFYRVLFPVSICDFPLRLFGIPVAETIMMPGDQGYILHSRAFGGRHPEFRVETYRIKDGLQFCIFRNSNVPVVHNPFSIAGHTKRAPMNKHPEAGTVKPFSCCEIFLGGPINCLSTGNKNGGSRKQDGEKHFHITAIYNLPVNYLFRYITSFT